MRTSNSFLAIVLFLLVQEVECQTHTYPWTIGVWGVKTEYIGNLGNNVFKFKDNNFHGGCAISFDRYLHRFFDIGIYGSVSSTGMNKGISTYVDFDQWLTRSDSGNEVKNFQAKRLYNIDIHTRFKILDSEKFRKKTRLVPYIGFSVGMVFYNKLQTKYMDANGIEQIMRYQHFEDVWQDVKTTKALTLGAIVGLEWMLSKAISLRYQTVGSWTNHDDYDFYVKKKKDYQLQHNVGITFSFNGKAEFLEKDTVFTYSEVVDTLVNQREVIDTLVNQTVLTGTLVKIDTLFNKTEVVVDTMFNRSKVKKAVVIDMVVKKRVNMDMVIQKTVFINPQEQKDSLKFTLHFATNQSEVVEAHISILDSIVAILIGHAEYIAIVSGHADNIGGKDKNDHLSNQRAVSVANYLFGRKVGDNRVKIKHYGFTKPVADNSTEEGQLQNRRVEILLILIK